MPTPKEKKFVVNFKITKENLVFCCEYSLTPSPSSMFNIILMQEDLTPVLSKRVMINQLLKNIHFLRG